MRTLYERASSERDYKYFARDMRRLVGRGTLLEYELGLERRDDTEFVWARPFAPRKVRESAVPAGEDTQFLKLRPTTYEKAKSLVPGQDIYALARMWEVSTREKGMHVRSPDAAFLGWCKTYGMNHPER